MGPRQFELPPNKADVDSPGSYLPRRCGPGNEIGRDALNGNAKASELRSLIETRIRRACGGEFVSSGGLGRAKAVCDRRRRVRTTAIRALPCLADWSNTTPDLP